MGGQLPPSPGGMMAVPAEPPCAPLPPPPVISLPPVEGGATTPAVPPSVMDPGPSIFGAPPHATAMATAAAVPAKASIRLLNVRGIAKLQCPGERACGGAAHGALGTCAHGETSPRAHRSDS